MEVPAAVFFTILLALSVVRHLAAATSFDYKRRQWKAEIAKVFNAREAMREASILSRSTRFLPGFLN
ncbi:hypothetical protein [Mesorhizobium sp. B4-1-4]|uniref:hypothetical protein n=1 Tax=Mesorhizobium sp. B4-1-4 TaxID=2589888 RepID=UPI00112A3960|nr:hypothetical protein [Mesorhizobium sp. B4-1-4]UCI29427.1 hypothetical protein FJW03_16345 [Mesorhizobium sp. B4-1-4]